MNKTFTQFLTVCFFALGAIFNTVQAADVPETPFITRWDLSKTGGANTELSFSVATSGTVNYTWQEVSPGNATGTGTFTGNTATITGLPADAVIDLSIEPTNFQRFLMFNGTDKSRLMEIKQWGSVAWTSMEYAFFGCNNMTLTATDVPVLTGVTNMSSMFSSCSSFNQALPEGFNTETVTTMSFMFLNCSAYNKELPSSFNTTAVTNMSYMFYGCSVYNQALPSSFTTAAVTNMSNMFFGCSAYNQALPSGFTTATVTNMGFMFQGCAAYNQALPSGFTTAAVTNMREMFSGCTAFNQSLASWGNQLNANVDLSYFLHFSGMSVANYDATLTAFSAGSVTGRNMGAIGLKYCTAKAARTTLTNSIADGGKGWTITGDTEQCPTPTITTFGTLTAFATCAGTASIEKSFSVSGVDLTADINITAPTGFEVSTTSGSGFGATVSIAPSSGTVANTTIFVRMAASATGSPSGNISCASTGATTKNVAASGTVNVLPTITLGSISSVNTTATSFSIPYTATTGSPDQYSLVAGTPTAMPSFTPVSNTSLPASPISVTIPASEASTYNFNLSVRRSSTGCVSAAVPVALEVTAGPPPTPFITRWDLSKTGGANTELSFGVATSGTVNYTWQEVSPGTASGSGTFTGTTATITGLPANAIIDLSIEPTNFQRFNMSNGTNRSRLMEIKQWGSVAWSSMENAFNNCDNMTLTATDVPNLVGVTNMSQMFFWCKSFNQALPEGFNTATVTNMSYMFYGCNAYNQALPSSFNTAAVTNMIGMFYDCTVYNQALPSSFNTAAVTNMGSMFRGCTAYNQVLPSSFNTAAVTSMSSMFSGCTTYNQVLPSSFNTAAVTDMSYMFERCTAYNQALPSSFNTAAVTNMSYMFYFCLAYNKALPSSFNTENVTNMSNMFLACVKYNQALPNSFNTENVTNMSKMFSSCEAFNQALPNSFNTAKVIYMNYMFDRCSVYNQPFPSNFNTAKVTDMEAMFDNCRVFNQPLPSGFNTANVTNMRRMFYGCKAFNQSVSNFNTEKVTNMNSMFDVCEVFNQSVSHFNVAAVTNMNSMFWGCGSFNRSLAAWGSQLNANVDLSSFLTYTGLTAANYDATLTAFAAGSVTGRNMGGARYYCNAETDRTNLVTPIVSGGKGWTISGDVKYCPPPSVYTSGTLTAFNKCSNTAGPEQSLIVDAESLTANLVIAAPLGFEFSSTSGTGFVDTLRITPIAGVISSQAIYIRLKAMATGSPNGYITFASSNITLRNLQVSSYTKPNINLGTIGSVPNTATNFSIPYISTSASPTQYSISTGTTNAMPSFVSVTNATLESIKINVSIPISANGTYNFNLTVSNEGCVSDIIPITLTVRNPNPAAINIKGNGSTIANNGTTASTSNYTDFGSINVSLGTMTFTYTIANTGDLPLNLTGTPIVAITGTHASDFTVINQPSSGTVDGLGTSSFSIRFDPSAAGTRTATVSIANSDASKNPYTFTIQGTGDATPIVNQYPYMVADMNQSVANSENSSPYNFTIVGTKMYFIASIPYNGSSVRSLWMTEGATTKQITTQEISFVSSLINVNNTLYFTAYTAANGRELYKYDGTSLSLIDVTPGSGNSEINNLIDVNGNLYFTNKEKDLYKYDGTNLTLRDYNPGGGNYSIDHTELINVNGTLYFTAMTATSGYELFKDDGTNITLVDINVGTGSSYPRNLTNINGTLYFMASTSTNGAELYKYDGTTLALIDINVGTGNSSPSYLTNVNGTLYFRAGTTANGTELYKYDGTTLTLIDINVGTGSSNPNRLTNLDGTLYFTANDATNVSQLFRYDNTSTSPTLVYTQGADNLTKINGTVYFSANSDNNGNELLKYDGTTTTLIDINSGTGNSYPSNFTNVNGNLYFSATTTDNGRELYKYDGISTTPTLFDIKAGSGSSGPSYLTNVNGTLYFSASTDASGSELWKSDGTQSGTQMVKDIGKGIGSAFNRFNNEKFMDINGTLYFTATTPATGLELYKYNGTDTSPTLIDINMGIESSEPDELTNVNGTLYFEASTAAFGYELYKYDGTNLTLIDINAGSGSSSPSNLTNVNGTLYFSAYSADKGSELYKYNGIGASPTLIDINEGSNGSQPTYLTVVNGVLYFRGYTSANGYELYKYDGTNLTLFDIVLGQNSSQPKNLTNVDGILYFVANGTAGEELYKYDGTDLTLIDIALGTGPSYPSNLTNANGSLYFSASTQATGNELFKYDGNTLSFTDINVGTGNSYPSSLTNVNGDLYFYADNGINGRELFKYDGNTLTLLEVNFEVLTSSTGHASPRYLTNVNGNVYFSAENSTNDRELFKTDGTPSGTGLVKDIWLYRSSDPENLYFSNNKLFFIADYSPTDSTYGRELWSLGNCLPTNIAVTSAGTNVNYNSEQQASPTTQSCHCDVFNKLITTINATGASPVSGNINSKVWIDATATANYVKRHYEIAPSSNPTTATGKVTLYFTQAEFDAFNTLSTTDLPANGTDATGKAKLRIKKYNGTSSDGTGVESTYSGTATTIDPTDSDIVWNATASRWEVSFDAVGFGGYFLTVDQIPTITTFSPTAVCVGSTVTITGTNFTGATAVSIAGNTMSTFTVNSATEISVTVGNSATTGIVSVTTPGGVATSTDILTVKNLPSVPQINGSIEICEGAGTTLTANSILESSTIPTPIITYGWTGGLTGSNVFVSPNTTRNYRVAATAEGCTSDSSEVFTLTVNPKPANPTITADNMSICKDGTVILTGSCSTANASFRWITQPFNNNPTAALPSSNQRTITEPGVYKGLCETDKLCLSDEISITITQATDCTTPNFLAITPEKPVICPGTAITMTATGCEGTLTWLGEATTPTGTSVSLSPTATTTYLVTCSTGGSATFTIVVANNTLAVGQNITTGKERFKAVSTLTSNKKVGNATITPGANVSFEAGNSITLLPGFTVEKWSIFKAEIKGCN